MAGRVGLEPTTSRFTVEVTVFYTTPAAVDHSGSRAKGDKFAPFDRGDFGLWLGGLQAVVPPHHKCKPTTPGVKSARPEGWLHIGPSAALRRLPDAPHRAARRAWPSGADLQPSNDPNLSPFALADDGVRSVGRSRCRHHEWRTRCIVVVIANCNSRLFFCRGDLI